MAFDRLRLAAREWWSVGGDSILPTELRGLLGVVILSVSYCGWIRDDRFETGGDGLGGGALQGGFDTDEMGTGTRDKGNSETLKI